MDFFLVFQRIAGYLKKTDYKTKKGKTERTPTIPRRPSHTLISESYHADEYEEDYVRPNPVVK